MKVSDRVKMGPMWKYDEAYGNIIKITKDYIVVSWDGVNGEWHYTHDQAAEKIEVMDEKR